MLSEKTTQEATYHYETAGELRCRYHDGRTRRAVLVLVTRLDTQARYSVLLPVDGHGATCSCPFFERKLKGTAAAAAGCKHISRALGHVLAEQARPAEVSPAILQQLGTSAEDEAKQAAEAARQERLRKAEEERRLWD